MSAKNQTIKMTVTVEYDNGDRGESSAQIVAMGDAKCNQMPPAKDYAKAVLAGHFRALKAIEDKA